MQLFYANYINLNWLLPIPYQFILTSTDFIMKVCIFLENRFGSLNRPDPVRFIEIERYLDS